MKKVIFIGIVILIGGGYFIINSLTQVTGSDMIIEHQLSNNYDGFAKDDYNTNFDEQFPFASRYFFRGNEANNFFWHQEHCFRIVNIAVNGHVKIMHYGYSENPNCEEITSLNYELKFSDERKNNWKNSNIKEVLKEWEKNNKLYDFDFTYDENIFINAKWYTGAVNGAARKFPTNAPITLRDHIKEERQEEVYQAKLGLITLSDYLKANSGSFQSYANHQIPRDNFLFQVINVTNNRVMLNVDQIDKAIAEYRTANPNDNRRINEIRQSIFKGINFWTLTADIGESNDRVYGVRSAQEFDSFMTNENSLSQSIYADNENFSFNPTLYLNGNLNFTGEGTKSLPYLIR